MPDNVATETPAAIPTPPAAAPAAIETLVPPVEGSTSKTSPAPQGIQARIEAAMNALMEVKEPAEEAKPEKAVETAAEALPDPEKASAVPEKPAPKRLLSPEIERLARERRKLLRKAAPAAPPAPVEPKAPPAAPAQPEFRLDTLAKQRGLSKEELYRRFSQEMLGETPDYSGPFAPVESKINELAVRLEESERKREALEQHIKENGDRFVAEQRQLQVRQMAYTYQSYIKDNSDAYKAIALENPEEIGQTLFAMAEIEYGQAQKQRRDPVLTPKSLADKLEAHLQEKAKRYLALVQPKDSQQEVVPQKPKASQNSSTAQAKAGTTTLRTNLTPRTPSPRITDNNDTWRAALGALKDAPEV